MIFDFDSTLVTIEGVDELAKFKGVGEQVAQMTTAAMAGEVKFETAFEERLKIIQPAVADVEKLANLYAENLTAGAAELLTNLQGQANLFVVSGGYKKAILKTTRLLGFADDQVFANELIFDELGNFRAVDPTSRLGRNGGKSEIIAQIRQRFPGPTILIGDGYSDLEAANCVDEFVCFAGVVERKEVVKKARRVVYRMNELEKPISSSHIQQK